MFDSLMHYRVFLRDKWRSRRDETIVVSYPKSGRTWHRAAIGIYLARVYNLDERIALDTREVTRLSGLPITSYSHNGANFLSAIDAHHILSAHHHLWAGRNILLLVRDPRAILVSSYHHMKSRTRSYEGTLAEFVRHPHTGIEKILVAYNRWHKLSKFCKNFLLQTYEGLHANHKDALRNALVYLGEKTIDAAAIEYSIAMTRFDNLRALEVDRFFEHGALNFKASTAEGLKVRKGKVDGYIDELSADDLDYIADSVRRLGNPFEKEISENSIGNIEHATA
jgi:Sulfotransferase domain